MGYSGRRRGMELPLTNWCDDVKDYLNVILFGDAREVIKDLSDNSVQCIVTSPPYFKKRKYTECNPKEIGREATPEEFIENLCVVFDELWRVLRDDGVLFINLGDTNWDGRPHPYLKDQDLCLTPHRFAIAMQQRGWILHNDNVWKKVNPTPVPSFKKFKPSHEYIFFFTKTNKYFFDYIAVREPAKDPNPKKTNIKYGGNKYTEKVGGTYSGNTYVPNGFALKKDVWTFTTASDRSSHCAVYPKELPLTAIKAGTSEHGACPICGKPFARIVVDGEDLDEWKKACGADKKGKYNGKGKKEYKKQSAQDPSEIKRRTLEGMKEQKTVGWEPKCDCWKPKLSRIRAYPACSKDESFWPHCQQAILSAYAEIPTVRCIVLDPFGGSGTTAQVAVQNGRDYILIELNKNNEMDINKKIHGE